MSLYGKSELNYNVSTGEREDSVLISYSDLRIVNSKLIQLDYEKQINIKLNNIIHNDSIIIEDYKNINYKINKDYNKVTKQRNIAVCTGMLLFIVSIISIMK